MRLHSGFAQLLALAVAAALAAPLAGCRKPTLPPEPMAAAPAVEQPEDAGAAPDPTDINYWREQVRRVAGKDAADAGPAEAAESGTPERSPAPAPEEHPRREARVASSRECEAQASAAWRHFNEGAVASAGSEVRAALALEPSCAPAHVVLGRILYQQGDFQAAIDAWEEARRLSPGMAEALSQLIAKARREMGVEAELRRKDSSHFVISFDGRGDGEAARRAVGALEEARGAVGKALDFYPSDAVPVILYPGEQLRETAGTPAWADGLYDGKIRVASAGAAERSERFKALLFHEYTHAVVHRLAAGRPVPAWLNEGLAQYAETLVPDGRGRVMTVQGGRWVSLTLLHESFSRLDARRAELAYTEARMAVAELVRRYRLYRLRELLERLASGKSFESAFEDTYLVSYERFARDAPSR